MNDFFLDSCVPSAQICSHGGGIHKGRIWRLWFYAISYGFMMYINVGTMSVQTMFFLSYPLCFTPSFIGIQGVSVVSLLQQNVRFLVKITPYKLYPGNKLLLTGTYSISSRLVGICSTYKCAKHRGSWNFGYNCLHANHVLCHECIRCFSK